MADKAEIAFVTTLTKSLCADEIYIVQIAIVDDVAAAEHGAEPLQDAIFREDVPVQTLQCLKMIAVFWVIGMPYVFPSCA